MLRQEAIPGVHAFDSPELVGDSPHAWFGPECCTNVCPEGITITDNAIIPLKERVVDNPYDPLVRLWRLLRRRQVAARRGACSS
jgi:hypothetical protein